MDLGVRRLKKEARGEKSISESTNLKTKKSSFQKGVSKGMRDKKFVIIFYLER